MANNHAFREAQGAKPTSRVLAADSDHSKQAADLDSKQGAEAVANNTCSSSPSHTEPSDSGRTPGLATSEKLNAGHVETGSRQTAKGQFVSEVTDLPLLPAEQPTRNVLDKELQQRLWRKKHDFTAADRCLHVIDSGEIPYHCQVLQKHASKLPYDIVQEIKCPSLIVHLRNLPNIAG